MPHQKTSKAEFRTARLNPINPAEAKVMAILEKKAAQGYNFKQVIVDAVLRAENVTPELFGAEHQLARFTDVMEKLLEEFAEKLLSSGTLIGASHEPETKKAVSKFTSNFVKGIQERNQYVDIDDET